MTRIVIDCTPLIGQRTGIGTYTAHLLEALVASRTDDEFVATAFTLRGRGALADVLPAGVEIRTRVVPARVLRALWRVGGWPPVEALTGPADLVHGTNFLLPPSCAAAGVVTVHDLAYLRFPETVAPATRSYVDLVPRGLMGADAICVPTQAVAHQLLDAYAVSPERVIVTPEGVDRAWFDTLPLAPAELGDLGVRGDYIVAVGTLEPRKNLGHLIEAYRVLQSQAPAAPTLVLVGGSGWGDAIDVSGLPDGAVVFTGHLPWDRLRSVVAGSRLLAFPSLDEGFGLPPLEALAAGVPVLASDLPVTREVLGDQARFAGARDLDAWVEGLRLSLDTPAGTVESRRTWAATFTWARCAEATRTAYRVAMESRARRG
ncbi:MAG: glycosyltransferase family 4 protein [Actinomycetales bacterium]|nr:glycosyltransferase family 4 protein [Actinomycetales bacterium]